MLALAVAGAAVGAASKPGLRVMVNGNAGVIHVKGLTTTHSCEIDCTYRYAPGTKLVIRAQPAANVTHFVGWRGGCTGSAPTCTLVLRHDTTVTARFAIGG